MHQDGSGTRDLLREGAEKVLNAPAEWLAEIDAAVLATLPEADPVVCARARRSNRLNILHWATSTIRAPGERVQPKLSAEMIEAAAEHLQRGSPDGLSRSYRAAETAAWLRWMDICFALTSDPRELRGLLDTSMRSISDFVESTLVRLLDEAASVREGSLRGSPAERLDLVRSILAGQPTDPAAAGRRLGYRLDQTHQAAILWHADPGADPAQLGAAADALTASMNGRAVLTLPINRTEIWLWSPKPIDPALLRSGLDDGMRLALGSEMRGLDGFRHSHARARAAQRMATEFGGLPPVVGYEAVRWMAVIDRDRAAVRDFVVEILGDFASASEDLHRSLLTYLERGCNLADAASRLGVHRNTLMRQIARAQDLLALDLDAGRIEVALALRLKRNLALSVEGRSGARPPRSRDVRGTTGLKAPA
jgi:DNA-binding PucR family transcriptional regulator